MNTVHDYESMGWRNVQQTKPVLVESYEGTAIVQWYGNIERQLKEMLADTEKGRNFPYADKIREYLKVWRSNEITGSINRETVDILKSAADMLSVDNWNLSNYFSNLRDQLRKLVASEEQLPRDGGEGNDPMRGGGGGAGGSSPPMSPTFGAEEEPPGGGGGAGGDGLSASSDPNAMPGMPGDEGAVGADGMPPEGAPGEAGGEPGGDQAGDSDGAPPEEEPEITV